MKTILGVVGVLLLIGVLGVVLLPIWVDESLETTKGTWLYYVTMPPKMIRAFPEISPVGEITYLYSCGDGNAPPFYTIAYVSKSQVENIVQQIYDYLQVNSFVTYDAPPLLCRVITYYHPNNAGTLELYLCQKKESTWTNVSITYYPK